MQLLLIATGENTKLSPLTADMPGPMLPIANRPVMALAIEMLARQGVKETAVSLYQQGDQIERYFGSGARWGMQLHYLLQREGWGDAGAWKWAESRLTDTTLALPADAIVDVNIPAVAHFHHMHGGQLTAILRPATAADTPVWLHPNGTLNLTSGPASPLAFTGAYVFQPDLLSQIPPRIPYTVAGDLIPALLQQGTAVYGYLLSGYDNPLCTFAQYQAAQQFYLDSALDTPPADAIPLRYPSLDSHRMGQGIWVGKQAVIHPAVRLRPPVLIGDNCRIGREVELGPYAIIGSDVVIDDEATIQHSTILAGTYVGQLVHVANRVVHKGMLIDTHTAETMTVTDHFLLGESSATSVGVDVSRFVDVLAALVLLWWLWPLLLLVGLVSWGQYGRFWQAVPVVGARRHTQTPITFSLWHFAAPPHSWLTRLGLHRLPELWNLLLGDITLVGVKPLLPEEAAQVTETWQAQRYLCPAGLTGLWAVQTTPESSLDEVLMADTYYVATRTWREEVKILWHTLWPRK